MKARRLPVFRLHLKSKGGWPAVPAGSAGRSRLDDAERLELSDALLNLSQRWGIGVLLVEHDVPMVMRTCQRIYALDLGKVIASGSPAEVRDNAQVIAAFLGPEAAESPVVPDQPGAAPGGNTG
jgi:ABC-type sulfate/molybdate transport systems ATPase subunit